jgi:acetate kinase
MTTRPTPRSPPSIPPEVRRAATTRLAHLGITVDEEANDRSTQDSDISAENAGARTLGIDAREDIQIAREARQVLARRASQA